MAAMTDNLKKIKPFVSIAKQYEPRDKVVAFYMYMHAVQIGIPLAKNDPVAKQYLGQILGKVETLKKEADQDAVKSDEVGQSHIEEVALSLFESADTKDRQAVFNQGMVKAFYASSILMEGLSQFGEPSDEILQKKKYAKWKAAEITRCLKSGIQPTSGPPGGDGNIGMGFNAQPTFDYSEDTAPGSDLPPSMYPPTSDGQGVPPGDFFPPPNHPPAMGFSQPYPPPVGGVSVYPDTHDSASKPVPKPRAQQPQRPSQPESYTPSNTGHNTELTFVEFQQAAKLARYAASALDYEDVPTAIMNLNKALKLLQTGKES